VMWTPQSPSGTSFTIADLGTLKPADSHAHSSAHGISAAGKVVGVADVAIGTGDAAFLWTPTVPNGSTGSMIDLGQLEPDTNLTDATEINANDWVIGKSALNGSASHPFLWTPSTGILDLWTLLDG